MADYDRPVEDGRAAASAEYRRQARRLRARLAHRPAELYRTLRALADQADLAAGRPRLGLESPAARFASHVRQCTDGQVLRYSQRTELIDAAERQGIGRFEANLIIAAVLHRQNLADLPDEPTAHRLLPAVVTFLLVQMTVLALAAVFLLEWRS